MSGKGRFWGAADEDSSSDSDSSSGSDSSSSVEAPKAAAGAGKAAPGARFAAYESDSESDDDRMRVARSVKERNLEKVLTILKSMASQLKTFNWVATLEEFEKLTAAYDRNQGALAKDGQPPRAYIRGLAALEDALSGVSRADTKKMSQNNARAVTRIKMAFKKLQEKPGFTAAMEAFRANPDAPDDDEVTAAIAARKAAAGEDDSDEEEVIIGRMGVQVQRKTGQAAVPMESDSSDSSDSDSSDSDSSDSDSDSSSTSSTASAPAAATGADKWKKKAAADKDADSESSWSGGDDSSSDSEDEDAYRNLKGRDRWVKRANAGDSDDEGKGGKGEREKAKAKASRKRQLDADAAAEASAKQGAGAGAAGGAAGNAAAATALLDVASLEGKAGDASAIMGKEWTRESLEKRVKDELASRGRKGVDPKVLSARLTALADVSVRFGPQVSIPFLMHAVSARYDCAKGLDMYLERSAWKRTARDIGAIIGMLEANPALRMAPIRVEEMETLAASNLAKKTKAAINASGDDAAAAGGAGAEAEKPSAASANAAEPATIVRVMGDLSILIERLHDDYVKSLQHSDPHKQEYLLRIGDESSVAVLADRAFDYYKAVAEESKKQIGSALSSSSDATLRPENMMASAINAAARLAILRVEHLHYKHDSVASQLRILSAAAEKRAEVAAIAASACAQAMAEARSQALEAHKAAVLAQTANANANANEQQQQSQQPLSSPTKQAQKEKEAAAAKEAASNPDNLLLAAADAHAVGEAASKLAIELAIQRGKTTLSVAAGVVAKSVIHSLSAREGSLLSAGAVAISRSPADLDLFADGEALPALQQAEAAGVDLQDLSTAIVAQQAGIAAGSFDSAALMAELCAFVYAHGEPRAKTRAITFQIYHHALHDRYGAGKDLLLMSKLQETIHQTDARVQISYNRALVQLGIAAFRLGLWQEAHECLNDICGSGHARELLAQGLSQARLPHNSMERDENLDKEERRRLVPYHLHISTDLAEACALTAAMLLEVPNIAAAEHDNRRKEISRSYRRHLDAIDAKTFLGPPESTRDSIMMAGLALSECDWRRALTLLNGVKAWGLWASNNRGGDRIKATLEQAVKSAALTTYLHSYSHYFDTLSLSALEKQFELPAKTVASSVAKMVFSGELPGRLDETTQCLVLQRTPPTKLQGLALEFSERVCEVADANERNFAVRTGQDRFGGRDDFGRGGFGGAGGGDGRYRRGERGGDGGGRGGYRGGAPRPIAAGRFNKGGDRPARR